MIDRCSPTQNFRCRNRQQNRPNREKNRKNNTNSVPTKILKQSDRRTPKIMWVFGDSCHRPRSIAVSTHSCGRITHKFHLRPWPRYHFCEVGNRQFLCKSNYFSTILDACQDQKFFHLPKRESGQHLPRSRHVEQQ